MPWSPPDAGELRTRVRVTRKIPELDGEGKPATDSEGYPVEREVNALGPGGKVWAKWVNAWGAEAYEARKAGVTEPATLTLRYTPLVTPECLIYKGEDPRPYQVVSVDDLEDRHAWLKVKVERLVRSE